MAENRAKNAAVTMDWLARANIITMAAIIRRDVNPEYPVITGNMLSELSNEEIRSLFDQLSTMMRSIGQVE